LILNHGIGGEGPLTWIALGAPDREKVEKRAMQEAQSAAKIHHPHAVTLFDVIPASDADAAINLIWNMSMV
jgi:hypothetical protein